MATSQADREGICKAAGRARLAKKYPAGSPQHDQPIFRVVGSATNTAIGFRVSSQTWVARSRFAGRYHYSSLGAVDDLPFKQAEQKATAFADSLTLGIETGVTVRRACLEYLQDKQSSSMAPDRYVRVKNRIQKSIIGRTKAETANQFGTILNHNVTKPNKIASKLLDELRAKDIYDWHRALVPPGLKGDALRKAQNSANHTLIALKSVLNWGYRMDLVTSDNAWRKVRAFTNTRRIAQSDDSVLSADDRKRLRATAKEAFPALSGLLEVLLLTGARRVEVRRAKITDYDKKTKTLRLVNYKGAGSEGRERYLLAGPLGIDGILRDACANRIPKSGPLFVDPETGSEWAEAKLTRKFRELFNEAGLRHLAMNITRHSFISEAVSGGVDLFTLSQHCGTSIAMISSTYARLIKSQSEEKLRKLRTVLG